MTNNTHTMLSSMVSFKAVEDQCVRHVAKVMERKRTQAILSKKEQQERAAKLKAEEQHRIDMKAYNAVYKRPTDELLEIIPLAYKEDIKGRFGKFTLLVTCESEPTEGGLQVIRLLLKRGAERGEYMDSRYSALTFFCKYDYADYLAFLLEHDCSDINWSCKTDGFTPVMLACMHGHTDCLRVLLEHGADTERHSRRKKDTALIYAIAEKNIDCVRLLLGYGACPDAQNTEFGTTALMSACIYNNSDYCELLLNHGATIGMLNRRAETVLDRYVSKECRAVIMRFQS